MTLHDLAAHFSSFPNGTIMPYRISEPFSWRGAYNEVCFSVEKIETPVSENHRNVLKAFRGSYAGYKGGSYSFYNHTAVNFEESPRAYTDGGYVESFIGNSVTSDPELELVERLFVDVKSYSKTVPDFTKKYQKIVDWIQVGEVLSVCPYLDNNEAFLACTLVGFTDKNELVKELDELGNYELIPHDNLLIFRFI